MADTAALEALELTRKLIGFRTLASRPEEIARCLAFLEEQLARRQVSFRRLEHEGLPSLAVTRPDGSAPVLLLSHIDVVDAPEDLFTPRVEDGMLFGRGSIDDKYAVALSVVLAGEMRQELRARGLGEERLPLGLLVTADEETGGRRGAKAALRHLRAEFAIALDGGNLRKIVVKEKGILRLRLTARGKAAHGARPWLGENAIERLIADIAAVRRHFALETPDHWHRTMNLSRIQGGRAVNQVPDEAEALFDIRYTEADDVDALVAAIRRDIQGELVPLEREPLFLGGESPYLERLRAIAGFPELGAEHGASDARFLSEVGIPGIVWGADGDASAHAADEHLRIDSLVTLHGILREFFLGLLPAP
ncbi:MAG: M20/M25/M40 family metallo-hydrolase [Desulfobacterales bacterium]